MRPMNEPATLEPRYRTMMILWFALLCSIGMFFLFAVLMAPDFAVTENKMLTLTFFAVGTMAVIISRFVKQRFLSQAVEKQDVALVQTGMISAAALCEVAAMLGLMDWFITGNRYYYVLFIIAVIGTLLNFPRRDHLLAASYKKPLN